MDGKGREGLGTIAELEKGRVKIQIVREWQKPRPEPALHLALGALRKGELEDILPALCEVGVDALHVFLHEGSPEYLLQSSQEDRFIKIMINACKQCKRSYLPTISFHRSLADYLQSPLVPSNHQAFWCHPDGQSVMEIFRTSPDLMHPGMAPVSLIIGAEGGFSAREEEMLRDRQMQSLNFGQQILRAKTAAILAPSFFTQWRDSFANLAE
jgi:16S rRNA (uracil1498-N3)-methyltransferase